MTGIAIAEGRIRGVDQTIGELLPVETRGLDSVKRSITVGQLLSMRSGLEPTSFGNYGAWVTSSNWVRNALTRPLVAEPGWRMLYSTGSTHLLSAILTRATGSSTFSFANLYIHSGQLDGKQIIPEDCAEPRASCCNDQRFRD